MFSLRPFVFASALAVLAFPALAQPAPANTPYDIVIENGHVIDGTGSPW
uniref:Protein tolB n=1 Tax=mine drainage metagenome TaxID=410659 RepID=E6Q0C7_9ZZZZ